MGARLCLVNFAHLFGLVTSHHIPGRNYSADRRYPEKEEYPHPPESAYAMPVNERARGRASDPSGNPSPLARRVRKVLLDARILDSVRKKQPWADEAKEHAGPNRYRGLSRTQ